MGAIVPGCRKDGECEHKDGTYCTNWESDCEYFYSSMEH